MKRELKNIKNKKILILGFGREGQSTLNFLRKYFPDKEISIADQNVLSVKDKKVKKYFGKNYLKSTFIHDLVFKSPGIPNKLPEIELAKKKGIKITSQTKLFFDLCEGKIIGVTGTKGKGTTTTLIFSILKEAKMKSILLGNIGKPCLDYFDKNLGEGQVFAFEISSHQLSDLNKSPHVGVFLNIFREHLDYYKSFADYFKAKSNVTKYQLNRDYFIYNSSQKLLVDLALKANAKTLGFSLEKNKYSNCYCKDGFIVYLKNKKEEKIISTASLPLIGIHNLNNVMAAVLVSKALKISNEIIASAIKKFKPLEHRLEEVGTYKGITFYDDTLATIPEATIAAINTFKGKIGTIILGGSDRGQDFKELAKKILEEKIKNVVLFPTTGERIFNDIKSLKSEFYPKVFRVNNMKDAVKACFENTAKREICLLSSASPSFNLFRDYQEKSELYRKYIEKIGRA